MFQRTGHECDTLLYVLKERGGIGDGGRGRLHVVYCVVEGEMKRTLLTGI